MNSEIFHKLQNQFAGVEDPAAKDIAEKIKKTYKNRYFMLTKN